VQDSNSEPHDASFRLAAASRLVENSRSEDGGQGRAFSARREAGLPLDGHRSGGYTRRKPRRDAAFPPRSFAFNTFTPQQPRVTAPVTANTPFDIELADSTHVDARKHGNASVYAVAGCMALIPQAFQQSYRKVSLQQPARDDVSCLKPMP
jgi:hypothetical protein